MKRRSRSHAALFVLALGAGACRLLVGVDDHHLRDDDAGAVDDANAETSADARATDARDEADANRDASIVSPYTVRVLATGRTRPSNVLVNRLIGNGPTSYVFWLEEAVTDGGAILRVPDNDKLATAEPLAAPANPRGLRFDGVGALLFADDTRPVARLWHGGTVPGFAPYVVDEDLAGRSFETLAVSQPYAFTTAVEPGDAGAHVRRTSIDSSGPTCFTYTATQATFFPAVGYDGANVYIADNASGNILRTGSGCEEVPVVFAAKERAVAFALDLKHLYWLTADGHVRSREKSMATATVTYGTTLVAPGGISDRGGTLYVTDEGAGIVYELPPPSASKPDPVVIATGQGGPHGIVVSTDFTVYWTNRTSGEIVRAHR